MRPLVSVIIPTFNNGKYISETLDTVINQTLTDFEIIIVDDYSTDNTEQLLKPILNEHSKIHYHRLNKNYGAAVARSEAIKMSKGKYCAFLDADDFWDYNKLEKQVSYMENDKINFSCTGYRLIDEGGQEMKICLIPPEKTNYRSCIRLSDPIGNLTVMYNQETLGCFTVPNIRKRNDFALWLQVLKKTEYCFGMPDILASYRYGRSGSISSNKLKLIKYHWDLYHRIEKHNCLQSFYEIFCWGFVKSTGIGLNKRTY